MFISITYKADKYCIMKETYGNEPEYKTGKIPTDVSDNRNIRFLYVLKKAILPLKVEAPQEVVVIEGSNSHVIKWFNKGESIKEHEDSFSEVYDLLCEIPCRFAFEYNKKPKASKHLDEETQVEISSADSLLSMVDE